MPLVFHIAEKGGCCDEGGAQGSRDKQGERAKERRRGDIAAVLQISSNYALKCAGSQ